MYTFSFEKLDVWQDSRALAGKIYVFTGKFPKSETFGLVSQLNRASISIASNIAEGSGRQTPKDQAHFTSLAYGSLMEVLNQLIISNDLGYVPNTDYQEIREDIEKVANKLNALRKSQLKRQ
jgi:four helix bundle protein